MGSEKTWRDYYNPEVNKKATQAYRKKSLVAFNFVMHVEHDRDIIAKLESVKDTPGKAKYVKQLIRDDIRRTGFKAPKEEDTPPVEPVPTVTPEEIEAREKEEALRMLGL